MRLLGARYLAQTMVSGSVPSRAVLALGAEVDAAHAASMMVLALLDPRRRRGALASALVAGGFALAGAAAARDTSPNASGVPGQVGFAARRDQMADHVAQWLVPGYPCESPSPGRTGAT